MNVDESAWVASEVPFCEAMDTGCGNHGQWILRELLDENGILLPEYGVDGDKFFLPRWVCDEHKVEPQPPEYAEWLAAQR